MKLFHNAFQKSKPVFQRYMTDNMVIQKLNYFTSTFLMAS